LHGNINLTSITGQVNLSAVSQPIIGQRRMAFNTTVELGSPTVIIGDRNASAAKPIPLNRAEVLSSALSGTPLTQAPTRQLEATVTRVN
jgi:hypothetical protein